MLFSRGKHIYMLERGVRTYLKTCYHYTKKLSITSKDLENHAITTVNMSLGLHFIALYLQKKIH